MPNEPIDIKPYHFVDILTAQGDPAYEFRPHPYGHAQHTVAKQVLSDPQVRLRMNLGADAICAPCVHNVAGLCDDTIDTSFRPGAPNSKREWNLMIDRRWCERLGLVQDDELTGRELAERIRDRAGDITDVYREIPRERTTERRRKLQAGVEAYLAGHQRRRAASK